MMEETGPCSRRVPTRPLGTPHGVVPRSWVSRDEQESPERRSAPGNWKRQCT